MGRWGGGNVKGKSPSHSTQGGGQAVPDGMQSLLIDRVSGFHAGPSQLHLAFSRLQGE